MNFEFKNNNIEDTTFIFVEKKDHFFGRPSVSKFKKNMNGVDDDGSSDE